MKLRTKIHLFTTLLMILLLIVMNAGVYMLYEQLSINTEYKQLKSRSEELLTALAQIDSTNDTSTVLRAYMPTNGAIQVVDNKGQKITSVAASLTLENTNIEIRGNEQYVKGEISGLPFIKIESPAIWIDGTVVRISLIQTLNDFATNQELLKLILIATTVLMTIPILLSNMALSRLILKPLERLNTAMKRSGSSGTYEKLEQANLGKDELAEIGRTFNGMMQALETNYKKQEQFVSNASHELKTPLTVIESYAKLLLRRGFTNEKVTKEALDAIVSESARMNEMIVQMLELAKNKEHLSLSIRLINIFQLVENTLVQMRQAYNRPFEISALDEVIYIESDEQKLKQILFILLDNARKYSDDKINVELAKYNSYITVSITDYGVGIPQDQLPHLFDRFFRVGEDRNRRTGGTGLGLAIAKELADVLNINIKVQSEIGESTCFTLFIPLRHEAKEDDNK
ncbi:MAG TPA: HAMP domain-containing sensor histidine kinase [Ureibacillus sp.]|nr:HAMP domain-containing sensor histidine kinase [Ureibacillus sp.]